MTEEKIEKIKASSVDIIVEKIRGKPYYSIKYFDLKENQGYIGFGSFNLDYVFGWKDKYFDIVEEEKRLDEKISDDLISRKSVIDILESIRLNDCNTARRYTAADIQERVENLPTAYDVDAVYKELEEELKLSDNEKERCIKENPLQFDSAKGIANAIDIVRNGGKKE